MHRALVREREREREREGEREREREMMMMMMLNDTGHNYGYRWPVEHIELWHETEISE